MLNRIRNLLKLINEKFGKEALAIFRTYENLNIKICDHQRFSLRCLSNDLIPVSLKAKNSLRTYKSNFIIHRAERGLLNERIRSINNTLEKLEHGRYMYELKLSAIVGPDQIEKCKGIIEDLKETRHRKVLEQQKFERVWLKKQQGGNSSKNWYLKNDHSNQVHTPSVPNKHWVVNLSNTPYLKHKKHC